jgi:hypothetical protein
LALGRASITVPSTSIASFLAIFSYFPRNIYIINIF